jgi:ribosomal protein S18 acetylase RimI-like enzyme
MNGEQITVRKATLNDLSILLDFEKGIIITERPFDPTLKDGDIHYYDIAQMIDAPHIEVVVAESGSEVIGSGYARIEIPKPYLKHQKHAFLGFMYTVPHYRGKGVNQKIIEALQKWSIKQGITEFRLEVYNDNLNAIRAYEKIGFSKLLITMRMELPAKTK